jgi:uncharacterized protein YbjT (DUF2867 family)
MLARRRTKLRPTEDDMSKKIIAVVGSTGAQGGGLVDAILASGAFAVRAITRKPDGDKGRALAARGVEVVGAELDDEASLAKAFAGAHGAYCVTNFWEHFSTEKEAAQAKNLAEAAKQAGVKHAIWSTLEDTRKHVPLSDDRMPTLQGKYKVPHFDAKGESDRFFTEAGVPTTFLLTSFYWDNLIHFGMGPKQGEDGKVHFALPMAEKKLAGIAARDIGRCALGVFERPELIGKTCGIMGEALTCAEMAAQMSRALDKDVVYDDIPSEVYRTLGFPGADDLANMFHYYRDFAAEFSAARDLAFSRSLNPELQTFAAFFAENKARIPL